MEPSYSSPSEGNFTNDNILNQELLPSNSNYKIVNTNENQRTPEKTRFYQEKHEETFLDTQFSDNFDQMRQSFTNSSLNDKEIIVKNNQNEEELSSQIKNTPKKMNEPFEKEDNDISVAQTSSDKKQLPNEAIGDVYFSPSREKKEINRLSHDEVPVGGGKRNNLFKEEDMYPKDFDMNSQQLSEKKKSISKKPFLKKKNKNEENITTNENPDTTPLKKPENLGKEELIHEENQKTPIESHPNEEISNNKPITYEDKPIKSNKNQIYPDERPIGRGSQNLPPEFLDERPIGGGKQNLPPEYLDNEGFNENLETQSAKKSDEPLANRLKSKVWKIRQEAFEELSQIFHSSEPNSEIFTEHIEFLPKAINDSNPASQEKALLAFQAFLEKAPMTKISGLDFNESIKTLIDKCLGPGKPSIKIVSNEILCILFEKSQACNNTSSIFDSILLSLTNKNQKTVCSGLQVIQELLINFGAKKMGFLKPFFNEMEKLAASTNSSIRNETLSLYKEAYKWLGEPVLRPFIANLKKAQIDELEKFFSENPNCKMTAKRVSDEKQQNKGDSNLNFINNNDNDNAIDPYDIVDAVDVFSKFNENWCEKVLGLSKWMEKKELLEEFFKGANVVKIVPNVNSSNFSSVMALLKKLLNDANINVVLMSTKILGVLAKGLRKNLTQNCKLFFPILIEKVKDKKTSLVEEIKNTLDNFFFCITIDDVADELKEILNDKGSPLVKIHALGWIERFIEKKVAEAKQSNKLLLKNRNSFNELLPFMKKLSEDGNGDIRDTVLVTLGKIMAVYGEPFLGDFVSHLNNVKLQKLNESAAKMNIAKKTETPTRKNHNKNANEDKKISEFQDEISMTNSKPALNKPPLSNTSNKNAANATNSSAKPIKSLGKSTTQKTLISKEKTQTNNKMLPSQSIKSLTLIENEENFILLSNEEAENALMAIFDENVMKNLNGGSWKEKLEALQEINNNMSEAFKDCNVLEAFLVYMKSKMKDWKESNLNLNKEFLSLIQKILSLPDKPFTKKIFSVFGGYFIEKLIENKKYTDTFHEITPLLLECISPKFITMQLINLSGATDPSKKPNPKLLSELCLIFNKIINLVTMSYLPLKPLLDYAKACLANTNPSLRTNSFTLLKTMYSFTGKELLKFLNDFNPQVQKSINSELETVSPLKENEKYPKISFTGEFGKEISLKHGGAPNKGFDNPLDSLPRADISNEVGKVLKKLNDTDWKVRREGIDNLDTILANNNFRVSLNGLLDLITVLKARLIEKNKNLSKGFILFTGKLAESVGKEIKPHAKTLLIPLISNLSDKQNFIRADTLTSMDKFADVLGPETIINLAAATFLANESPEMRGELINWMLKNQECLNKCDIKSFSSVLLNCLIDRNKEVRAASELLFEKAIQIIGLNEFKNKLQDFKPAVIQQLKPIFDKYASFAREVEINSDYNQNISSNKQKKEKEIKSNAPANNPALPINKPPTQPGSINVPKNRPQTPNKISEPFNTNNTADNSFKVYYNALANNNNNSNNNTNSVHVSEQETFIPEKMKHHNSSDDFHANSMDNVPYKSGFFPQNNEQNKAEDQNCQGIYFGVGCLIADSASTAELKKKRIIEENNNPWSLDEISDDLAYDLLKNLKKLIDKDLNKKLFSLDFKKHLEAMEVLSKVCINESQNIKEISDLIIKWCFIRVWGNTNSLIISNIIRFLKILFSVLAEKNYCLLDFEAKILMGLLKESIINDYSAKNLIIDLHDFIIKIYPEEKISQFWIGFYQNSRENDSSLREIVIELLINKINSFSLLDLSLFSSIPELINSTIFLCKLSSKFSAEVLKTHGFLVENNKKENFGEEEKNENIYYQKENEPEFDIYALKKQEIQNKTFDIHSKYNVLFEKAQLLKERAMELKANKGYDSNDANVNSYGYNNQIYGDNYNNNNQLNFQFTPVNNNNAINKFNESNKPNATPKKISSNNLNDEGFYLIIKNLKEGSITKKIDSLLIINDMTINENEEVKLLLKAKADLLAKALKDLLQECFNKNESTPNQFIHYFLNILHKTFSLKMFTGSISNNILSDFCDEMILRLISEDEAKQNNAVTHSYDFLKLLNSIMLRILENSNLNEIFFILFDLLVKYRRKTTSFNKLLGLIVKCLLKITKNMESRINEVRVDLILLRFHQYIIDFPEETNLDEAFFKSIRILLTEFVKILGESIWISYASVKSHEVPDQYLEKWILAILKAPKASDQKTVANSMNNIPSLKASNSMQFNNNEKNTHGTRHISPFLQRNTDNSNPANSFVVAPYFKDDTDLRKVIEKIKRQENLEFGLNYLTDHLEKHPGFNLLPYFHECPQNFINYIIESIEGIRQARFQAAPTEKTLNENPNYQKNYFNNINEQMDFIRSSKVSKTTLMNTNTRPAIDYENIQSKINQIKMRYGNMVKNKNNENDEGFPTSTSPNFENTFTPPFGQQEPIKNFTLSNVNEERVLQKINEMRNKALLSKK